MGSMVTSIGNKWVSFATRIGNSISAAQSPSALTEEP
jgi:hypothetical protein